MDECMLLCGHCGCEQRVAGAPAAAPQALRCAACGHSRAISQWVQDTRLAFRAQVSTRLQEAMRSRRVGA